MFFLETISCINDSYRFLSCAIIRETCCWDGVTLNFITLTEEIVSHRRLKDSEKERTNYQPAETNTSGIFNQVNEIKIIDIIVRCDSSLTLSLIRFVVIDFQLLSLNINYNIPSAE